MGWTIALLFWVTIIPLLFADLYDSIKLYKYWKKRAERWDFPLKD